MNSHLIRGVSPGPPWIFFYQTVTCQPSCIFFFLHSLSNNICWLFCIHFQTKNLMVVAPSSRYLLLRGIGRKKTSLLYIKVFLWVVFSLTSEFFFAPARIIFFFRSRQNDFFFSPASFFRSRRNIFFPPFCPRASIRRWRTFFFPRAADLGTRRVPRRTSVLMGQFSFHASIGRTHSAQIYNWTVPIMGTKSKKITDLAS